MKTILSLMVLIPFLSFSQVSHWRSGGSSNYTAPRISTPQVYTQPNNSVSQWRSKPSVPQNPRTYTSPRFRNYRYFDAYPYYGLYGYYYSVPYYWYDPYGYRVRGYVHHYQDGKMDTVKGQPIHINMGVHFGSNNMVGGYITVGTEGYFIAEVLKTRATPNTTFFPNGRLSQVDFPMVSDEANMSIVYLGLGKMINHKTGYHFEVGLGNDEVNYRGKDALGYITFPKYKQNFVTLKVGILHNYKNFNTKFDIDPIKGIFTGGIGVHF
jgi:hypothetical protein